MRLRFVANLLLAIFVLSATHLLAETLSGVVRDPSGAGLDQAVVVVQQWGTDSRHHPRPDSPVSVQPDLQGRYSITLTPGVYDVLVSCPFCSPQVKQVKLKPGKDLQFNPELKFSRFWKGVE
jgi:hypothetical protein